MKRLHDTRADVEIYAGVAKALSRLLNDNRFADFWKFVDDGRVDVYLQRIMSASSMAKGYKVLELEKDAKEGIPALLMSRTYPKIMGWEQANENKKWYTKTGRLEFYREEDEFIEYGENLPVYREPVDGTIFEPNVIVAKPHPAIKPAQPEKYGLAKDNLSTDVRQVRNVMMSPEELLKSNHPLKKDGWSHVYITPKYRHGAHTTPIDTDIIAIWFGPFGDPTRRDKRTPGWAKAMWISILKMPRPEVLRTGIMSGWMPTPRIGPITVRKSRAVKTIVWPGYAYGPGIITACPGRSAVPGLICMGRPMVRSRGIWRIKTA